LVPNEPRQLPNAPRFCQFLEGPMSTERSPIHEPGVFKPLQWKTAVCLALLVGGQLACSSSGTPSAGLGGSQSVVGGAASSSGGSSNQGATTANAQGGSVAGGATAISGGSSAEASGGTSATTGGTKSATGGVSAATGGASAATGGTKTAGGASSIGGTTSTASSGGASAGTTSTTNGGASGGATASSSGGIPATGGAPATGGLSAAGGTATVTSCMGHLRPSPSAIRAPSTPLRRAAHGEQVLRHAGVTDVQNLVDRAVEQGARDHRVTAARLDRCLSAAAEIDRNANQATLIECWADDLAVGRGEDSTGNAPR